MEGETTISIDEDRVIGDSVWDGLKGYVTNTTLSPTEITEKYGDLWQIERAFRISKTDLKMRPIFHRLRRRIEAHLTIAFTAYAVYKEFERLAKKKGISCTGKRAAELSHTMYEIEAVLPGQTKSSRKILRMDAEQQEIYDIIHRN